SDRSHFSRPLVERCTRASFLALTRTGSTFTGPEISTPYSAALRASRATYALATRVLVGVQPLFTQVPPNLPRSMMATRVPALARRSARAGPAWPVPMMMASYAFMGLVLHRLPCREGPELTGTSRGGRVAVWSAGRIQVWNNKE